MSYLRENELYKNNSLIDHHVWYPSPEGLTPWYCRTVVRNGLWNIASLMLQLSNESNRLDRPKKLEFYSHLEVLAEVLLEVYSGAITAKTELEEDSKGLLNEYWNRRDTILSTLYQQVKSFVELKHQVNFDIQFLLYSDFIYKRISIYFTVGCYVKCKPL